MKAPTLFLDIDGVLVTRHFWKVALKKKISSRDSFGNLFDPFAVKNLNKIIEEFDPDIVISSIWRLMGLEKFLLMWNERKMRGRVIGTTNNKRGQSRGSEIQSYIEENNVDKYVIIDDDSDMLKCQIPFFVKTTFGRGFTEKDADKIRKILL